MMQSGREPPAAVVGAKYLIFFVLVMGDPEQLPGLPKLVI
jgi:hypothetical protein